MVSVPCMLQTRAQNAQWPMSAVRRSSRCEFPDGRAPNSRDVTLVEPHTMHGNGQEWLPTVLTMAFGVDVLVRVTAYLADTSVLAWWLLSARIQAWALLCMHCVMNVGWPSGRFRTSWLAVGWCVLLMVLDRWLPGTVPRTWLAIAQNGPLWVTFVRNVCDGRLLWPACSHRLMVGPLWFLSVVFAVVWWVHTGGWPPQSNPIP